MRILSLLFVLLLQVGVVKAQSFDKYFDQVKSLPDGRMLSDSDIKDLYIDLNSHFGFTNAEVWLHEEPNPAAVKAAYPEFRKIMSQIPLDNLRISAFNDMNMLMVYVAPVEKEAKVETADNLEVLVLWNINYHGLAIVIHGTMTRQNYMLLQCGKVSMDFFGTSITPMSPGLYDTLIAPTEEVSKK